MSDTAIDTTTAEKRTRASRSVWRKPRFRVEESSEAFRVKVEVPGVHREGVDVSVEDDTLSISAKRAEENLESWRVLRRENAEGDFRLDLQLNVPLDRGSISARVENGLLSLDLPKSEQARPRKIDVN